MTFGEKLRKARKARKLSQQDLARRIGVKSNSISNWETGLHIPKNAMIMAIARNLGVTTEYLAGFSVAEGVPGML